MDLYRFLFLFCFCLIWVTDGEQTRYAVAFTIIFGIVLAFEGLLRYLNGPPRH